MFWEEHIYGYAGNDQLYGNGGDDVIEAGRDEDVLYGGSDNDILLGQSGDDLAYGGVGLLLNQLIRQANLHLLQRYALVSCSAANFIIFTLSCPHSHLLLLFFISRQLKRYYGACRYRGCCTKSYPHSIS